MVTALFAVGQPKENLAEKMIRMTSILIYLLAQLQSLRASIYTLLCDGKQHDKTLDIYHSWNDDDTPKRCAFKQPSF